MLTLLLQGGWNKVRGWDKYLGGPEIVSIDEEQEEQEEEEDDVEQPPRKKRVGRKAVMDTYEDSPERYY